MDTLEKCLSIQPKETTRYDETMNVKALLKEICHVSNVKLFNKKKSLIIIIISFEKQKILVY